MVLTVTDAKGDANDVSVSDLVLGATSYKGGDKVVAEGKIKNMDPAVTGVSASFVDKVSKSYINISGSCVNGNFILDGMVDEYAASGKYELSDMYLNMRESGVAQYGKASDFYGKEGYAKLPDSIAGLSFTVSGTKTDKEAPILNSIIFDNTTVNVPGKFFATIDFTEKGSGLDYVAVEMKSKNSAVRFDGVSSTKRIGIDAGQYINSGKYIVNCVTLRDKAGNTTEYYAEEDEAKYNDAEVLPESVRSIELTVKNDDDKSDGTALDGTTSTVSPSLVTDIQKATGNIHVDFSGYHVLPKEALQAIKGQNKTLLLNSSEVQYELNGKDVTDASKDWNLNSTYTNYISSVSQKVLGSQDALLALRFEEAGTLPGKTKVRLNMYDDATVEWRDSGKDIYLYSVDCKSGDKYSAEYTLSKVAGPVKMTPEGNIEFYLTSRPSQPICITPGPAKATSFKVSTYSVHEKFSDVKNTWYTEWVQKAIDMGIMKGTGTGTTFEPDVDCNRAMMVQILYNAKGAVAGAKTPFKDVKAGAWYEQAVTWAYNHNVTSGISKTEFGVNTKLTREQVAKFLYGYAQNSGYNVKVSTDLSKYSDAGEISSWATDAMKWANAKGIVNGTSATTLSPKKTATRAEIAKMVVVYMETIEGKK